MRKGIIIFIVVVVVLILAVILRFAITKKGSEVTSEFPNVPVEVVTIKKNNVQSTCEVLGTVVADKTAQIFPETTGRVTRILVKEGSYVSKNSNIMAIRNETIGFNYEEGYITSPISGYIGKIYVDVGSMISPQTMVALVVEFSTVDVEFNISEVQGGCIKRSQIVSIEADGIPGQIFSGKIAEISPVIDPMTRTISAKAVIDNNKKLLKPGMTARVKINLGSRNNVVAIPKESLLDSHLFVVEDSTAVRRDVTVGLIGDESVEILAGVAEGERVVVIGQERLAGGERVNPIPRSE